MCASGQQRAASDDCALLFLSGKNNEQSRQPEAAAVQPLCFHYRFKVLYLLLIRLFFSVLALTHLKKKIIGIIIGN